MPSATCLCSASSEWRPGTHWSRQESGGHHTRDQRFVWVVEGGFTCSGLVGVALRYLALRPVMGVALRYLAPRPVMGVALPHAAPGQGVSRPPHAASRDCRNGSPLARAIPCAPAPECGVTREKETVGERCNEVRNGTRISASDPTRSAASRAGMAGWAGEGGGRFGERREYEAPTLPSTPRQHGAARHQTRQPGNSSPPHTPAKKQHTTITPPSSEHTPCVRTPRRND